MPGIVVFRRRWMVASDDFVIPFGLAFALRVVWMITLAISTGIYHGFMHGHLVNTEEQDVCEQTLDYFIGGYLALLFATNIMELSISWMSSKGSIMDTEPRNLIPQLLYVRLMLTTIELIWLSLGIKWIFLDMRNCGFTSEVYIARAIVIFNWIFLFVVGIIVYCSFDSAGRSWFHLQRERQAGCAMESTDGHSLNIIKKYEEKWVGRFRVFCCCRGSQGDDNVLTSIGSTLSEYFQDLDIVPSDFAAGLVLLRKQQKKLERQDLMRHIEELTKQDNPENKEKIRKKNSMRYQRTRNARSLRMDDKQEMLLFMDVVHYMNYALAAYGWPLYMKGNLGIGCCQLGPSFRCCYTCRNPDRRMNKAVDVESDNCCRCNFSALKRFARLDNCDVTYVSYHNKLYQSPFFVALDHEKKTVVVTVRGTLSLHDMLTDSSVEAAKIPMEDGDPDWFGHKGMIKTALYIRKRLENGMLERAFNADPERGTKLYRLVLVGHSLGAGTVAILALLLRPTYPDLFCYAYSPPGATLSLSAAKYARDFTISVVVGKDMIPRLSLCTLEDLRNKILTVISHSNLAKWKILRGCACRCAFLCCCRCKCVDCDSQMSDDEDDLDAERLNLISNARQSETPKFYPPGRIIHIVKTLSPPGCLGQRGAMFEPVWADLEDFQTLQISSLMWADHMPDFVLKALNKCLPSQAQEEAVLNAPDLGPNGATSELPLADWMPHNHVATLEANEIESSQAQDIPVDSELNTLAQTEFEKALRMPSVVVRNTSSLAPLARPESGLDDSDLEDDSAYRVSRSWADFTLSTVQQSSESLNTPRPAASTENFPSRSSSTLPALPNGPPPPKPPRTFATEISEGRPIVRVKAPPKPPRTFDYDPRTTCNYSSLDWNFPRPKDRAALLCSHNSWNGTRAAHTSQQSCDDSRDALKSSQNSWNCNRASDDSRAALDSSQNSWNRSRACDDSRHALDSSQTSWNCSRVCDDSCSALNSSQNSLNVSCEGEHTPENEVLPPYSSHKRHRIIADSSGSDRCDEYNTFLAISPGADSREGGVSGKLDAWFSFSDSVVNIDLEESMLLGSVKPRRGRRRRQTVAATSQVTASSTPSLTKSLLETTL